MRLPRGASFGSVLPMSGFEENIVREYFEQHGFYVRPQRRAQVGIRRKTAEERIDFTILNPAYAPTGRDPAFLLFTSELPYLERAIVVPKAWHGGIRLLPTLLRSNAEILKFIEKQVAKEMEAFEEEMMTQPTLTEWKRILVLPGLPTADPHRADSVALLRSMGVDGIISFRTMLQDVIAKLEGGLEYEKSPHLQSLRVLKAFDLLKEPQMGLFKDGAL